MYTSRRGLLVTLAALLAMTLAVASCTAATVRTVTLVAAGVLGDDAFFDIGAGNLMNVIAGAGGAVAGDRAGLYGGTTRSTQCSKKKLITYLKNNPDKAAAWADVLGMDVADIPGRVGKLTSVVLRRDVLVKNHGYRKGGSTAFHALLQAGIAVLVDSTGTPVVKCDCGNPLLPPDGDVDIDRAKYKGKKWKHFSRKKVAVIEEGDEQPSIKLAQLDPETGQATGEAFDRPTGTEGEQDSAPTPTPNPDETPTPCPASTDPQATTLSPCPEPSEPTDDPTDPPADAPTDVPTDSPTDSPTGDPAASDSPSPDPST
ncbi:hypothetical protein FXF51_20250 [Nonomuraea sp. PA05]|uniref:DUF6777 domain-containing protein n=1 Tax=Nonomuraea sp. PA05 TaxID=2604466 RepID=UPI0011D364D0|nr:DUF6777 domain-containing protein [Nonomuraea sp. PA05]TYB64787.1 hypothetical protein FXF51_20250 [Nonomuraea sp. PA05]